MKYYTIQGKLTGHPNSDGVCNSTRVHPDLEALGVERIEIDFIKEQVSFIYKGNNLSSLKCFLSYFIILDNEATVGEPEMSQIADIREQSDIGEI